MSPYRLLCPIGLLMPALACAAWAGESVSRLKALSSPPASLSSMTASGDSFPMALTGNGRFVIFISRAANLAPNDDNGTIADVFVRDLDTKTTMLVSANATGTGSGNNASGLASISSDGRWAVFESKASNLVVNDANGAGDVFVRDLVSGMTALVSVNLGGGSGNGASSHHAITPDGRFVVFESLATDLAPEIADANGASDIFVRDLKLGTTVLVSRHWSVPAAGNSASTSPAITPDGRWVVFVSTATNIAAGISPTSLTLEVFAHDLETQRTVWVSRDAASLIRAGCWEQLSS